MAEAVRQSRLNMDRIREDFPILKQRVFDKDLVYFDNAATAQKPLPVIEVMDAFYRNENSNVHRGVHSLSQSATNRFEEARETVRRFLNASSDREIVFTGGTTEACNLVAHSFGARYIHPGDEIVISGMEHHANIVPWQMVCEARGAVLKVIPVSARGELELDEFENLLGERTRIVSIAHVSNTLGTVNPVKTMIRMAHDRGIPVMLDGAQAVPHGHVDVRDLDVDFYCFSGHKLYGPMGIGVLYGKTEYLEELPPFLGGGSMIRRVTFEKTTYNDLPHKFETGTPNVAAVLGLAAAIDYLDELGWEAIAEHEKELTEYGLKLLSDIDGLRMIGTAPERVSLFSFVLEGMHPYDTGLLLDRMGIATRTGHHCTEPLHDQFGIPGSVRASLALYNTRSELDRLAGALKRIRSMVDLEAS